MAHQEIEDFQNDTDEHDISAELNNPDALRRRNMRKRVCKFCTETAVQIDYKDAQLLRSFITERGKIVPRRISGACAKHQRKLSLAIARARNIALLPFIQTH